jgi:hypothetical protein
MILYGLSHPKKKCCFFSVPKKLPFHGFEVCFVVPWPESLGAGELVFHHGEEQQHRRIALSDPRSRGGSESDRWELGKLWLIVFFFHGVYSKYIYYIYIFIYANYKVPPPRNLG